MYFLSNFGYKIIFMCSVNFCHQQDSNSLCKGSIGHVTSYCKWPIVQTRSFAVLKALNKFIELIHLHKIKILQG